MDMQMLADHSSLASSVKERLQCPRPAFQLISPMEAAAASASGPLTARPAERIERLVGENAVVVFSVSTCCMCHVAKKLLCGMGVSPLVVELDELDANSHLMALQDDVEDIEGGGAAPGGGPLLASGADIERALVQLTGERPAVPCVFVGGKLIGGLDRLMAAHISGSLIPQLKQAGALWL